MKVTIAREELLASLVTVSRGLSSRTTLPILSGIHISASSENIIFQATDLEVSIKTSCRGHIENQGQSVLPGKLLTNIIRSFPDAAVTIDTTVPGSAELQCGQSSFKIKTLQAEDYPKFPDIHPDELISLPSTIFSNIVNQVSRSVSRDEARPILTGILLIIQDNVLRMVTTDSYRLCIREIPIEELSGSLELIIPGKTMEDIAKLASVSEFLKLGVSENQIIFSFDSTTFISRRIEGTFPNYRQLLPKEYSTRVIIDRSEFLEAVKRISLMAQHSAPIRITVSTTEHTLTLSSGTQDIGEANEIIQVTSEGDDVEIAFNHTYLLDGISVAENETVAIEITSPLKPGVIRLINDPGFIYLLMPVRFG